MKNYAIVTLFLFIFNCFSCANAEKSDERTKIKFETNKGTIIVALYNETPLHRANFIKLTKQKYFDGTLFHRVINDFMIQGGDPDSKNAKAGEELGNGGPDYRIPAEFRVEKGIFHKKGALAAARDNNPKQESAGSQFYLVEGKVFTLSQLESMENKKNAPMRKKLIHSFKKEYKHELDSLIKLQRNTHDTIPLQNFVGELNKKIDTIIAKEGFQFSEAQKKAYTTVGGTPHLDGGYTVFGEILEGQEVVDKIAEVETDKNDRPLEDIKIKKAYIIK